MKEKYLELLRRVLDCADGKECANIRDEVDEAYVDGEISMGQRFILIAHLNRKEGGLND